MEQVEVADVVVMNKADLAGAQHAQQLEVLLGAINPLARVLTGSWGQV